MTIWRVTELDRLTLKGMFGLGSLFYLLSSVLAADAGFEGVSSCIPRTLNCLLFTPKAADQMVKMPGNGHHVNSLLSLENSRQSFPQTAGA